MQRKQFFRWMLSLSLLVAASLACNFVTGIGNQVNEVRETAESVATNVETGKDIVTTGQAVATQVLGSELGQTVQAFATSQGPSILETVQNFSTSEGPGMLETVQAFATDQGPGIVETAQAFTTDQAPGLLQTVQAAVTSGEPPEDIPVVGGQKDNLFTTASIVSYSTSLTVKEVQAFYEEEMPANGWAENKDNRVSTEDTAVLQYEKSGRKATVTINLNPIAHQTIVLITILP